jgi:hypothetical protein
MRIEFLNEFNDIREYHILLLKSKSIVRHRRLLSNIENLKSDMKPFLEYDFDPDIDIDQSKLEARNIMVELDKIKSQIP